MNNNMTNEQQFEAYKICQQRGHASSALRLMSNPPKNVCKYCGTHYWVENVLHESNIPGVDNNIIMRTQDGMFSHGFHSEEV